MSNLYTIQLNQTVKLGPMALGQLEEMIRQGRVKPSTLIFTHHTNRWHLAATLPEIRELLDKHHPNRGRIIPPTTSPEPEEAEKTSSSHDSSKKNHESRAGNKISEIVQASPDDKNEIYTIRANDGVEYGPTKLDQVKKLVKQEKIKATTMVFTRSSNRWHLAASVPEVRILLRKYNPSQDDILNRIRALSSSNPRDSAHTAMGSGRISTVRFKRPFWKKFFSR